jgi:hypothetical protein
MTNCKFCNFLDVAEHSHVRDGYDVKCPRCGEYFISGTAMGTDLHVPAHLLSAATRLAWDSGRRLEVLTDNQNDLIASVRRPSNPLEAI